MRFNYRWLKEYLDTPLSYEKLLDAITMSGHEVEESVDLGVGNGNFVFGEIVELERHPNADKLSVCKVRADGDELLQIVCGAQNIEVGQHVPLAKIGAVLPDGMKLKPTKIRGIDSQGMMCSGDELGIEKTSDDGIWIQPADSPIGQPFDGIIDIKITPNRPDALSLIGLARDLAAKTGGKLKMPEVKFSESKEKAETAARVVVEARNDCPRYAARVIRNVKIGPSPKWLKCRLEAAGLSSINNVVDVTNYVMLEMGHPLHAFDLDTLASKTVIVRLAKPGEKMRLLDDSTVQLESSDLLIADPEKPIALAGIMGGGDTEITDNTTNVLLEAAYFRPSTIRRTSKRLGKSTDSSYRFERGTDYKRLVNALHRAAQLIAELAGGEVLKGHLDVLSRIEEPDPITLRIDKFCMLSGLQLTGRQLGDVLTKLGFEIQRVSEKDLTLSVPSHRPDIFGEADLVEEVARIYGYDRIPVSLPSMRNAAESQTPVQRLTEMITDKLVALGMNQAINFSFVSEGANIAAGFEEDGRTVKILNPLKPEQSVMRRSLVPSLLENVVRNLNQSVENIRLFEIGRTYAWAESEYDEANDDMTSLKPATDERLVLCAAMCGSIKSDWRTASREYDFFDIKGIAQSMLDSLGITRVVIEPLKDHGMFHPGRAAALLKNGERLCWFGELHPAVAHELGLKKRVFLLECPLEGTLLEVALETPKYREIPKTPSSKRDIALVVSREVAALDLERTIRSSAGELLTAVNLFDVYEGKHIEEGKKSLAFTMTFHDPDPEKTLVDDAVNQACDRVIASLERKHGAALRG